MADDSRAKHPTCDQRIQAHLDSRLENIRAMWDLYQEDPEAYTEDGDTLHEYGLAFDYVAPETFQDQEEGYFRYQLSWGGPSDEFRFFVSGPGFQVHRIEYWFLDWFDGASRRLYGQDRALLEDIFQWFAEGGSVEHAYEQAREE